MGNYPSIRTFKQVEENFGLPIIAPLAGITAAPTKYVCILDYILIGPMYIEFTEPIGEVVQHHNYEFKISRMKTNHFPVANNPELMATFKTDDFFTMPESPQVVDMKPGNLLALDLEAGFLTALGNGDQFRVDYQIRIEVVKTGTPDYVSPVNFYFEQYKKDLSGYSPY